jgi:hypothetical protein
MSEESTPRALVAYESMFGNTERVAHAVATGLRLEGFDATVVDVSRNPTVDLDAVDLLVVGAPTHAFSLSRSSTRAEAVQQGARPGAAARGMREWLHAWPTEGRTPLAAAFDTRVTRVRYLPACASRRAARLLVEHGCTLLSVPTGFLVHDVSGPVESREIDRAIGWSRRVAIEARNRTAASVL